MNKAETVVWVIDDDEQALELVNAMLTPRGYKVYMGKGEDRYAGE